MGDVIDAWDRFWNRTALSEKAEVKIAEEKAELDWRPEVVEFFGQYLTDIVIRYCRRYPDTTQREATMALVWAGHELDEAWPRSRGPKGVA